MSKKLLFFSFLNFPPIRFGLVRCGLRSSKMWGHYVLLLNNQKGKKKKWTTTKASPKEKRKNKWKTHAHGKKKTKKLRCYLASGWNAKRRQSFAGLPSCARTPLLFLWDLFYYVKNTPRLRPSRKWRICAMENTHKKVGGNWRTNKVQGTPKTGWQYITINGVDCCGCFCWRRYASFGYRLNAEGCNHHSLSSLIYHGRFLRIIDCVFKLDL